jgi:hypothetical protein
LILLLLHHHGITTGASHMLEVACHCMLIGGQEWLCVGVGLACGLELPWATVQGRESLLAEQRGSVDSSSRLSILFKGGLKNVTIFELDRRKEEGPISGGKLQGLQVASLLKHPPHMFYSKNILRCKASISWIRIISLEGVDGTKERWTGVQRCRIRRYPKVSKRERFDVKVTKATWGRRQGLGDDGALLGRKPNINV